MAAPHKVGEIVGQYRILSVCKDKKNNNYMYDAICIKCGYIRRFSRYVDLKDVNENCVHFSVRRYTWSNNSLRKIRNGMIRRCYDTKCKSYRFYGAKGITVCDEWLYHPEEFDKWAQDNGYEEGLTIDRIDSSGNYEPLNCRWVTREENSKWKSSCVEITVDDVSDTLRGWSYRLGYGRNWASKIRHVHGEEYLINRIKKELSS